MAEKDRSRESVPPLDMALETTVENIAQRRCAASDVRPKGVPFPSWLMPTIELQQSVPVTNTRSDANNSTTESLVGSVVTVSNNEFLEALIIAASSQVPDMECQLQGSALLWDLETAIQQNDGLGEQLYPEIQS